MMSMVYVQRLQRAKAFSRVSPTVECAQKANHNQSESESGKCEKLTGMNWHSGRPERPDSWQTCALCRTPLGGVRVPLNGMYTPKYEKVFFEELAEAHEWCAHQQQELRTMRLLWIRAVGSRNKLNEFIQYLKDIRYGRGSRGAFLGPEGDRKATRQCSRPNHDGSAPSWGIDWN